MAIVRNIEVIAQSPNGFDDACREAIRRRWTSYPLSRTGWLRPRHALASRDEGMELVSMKEGSGLRLCWCAVVWVKENLPLQQHAGHPKQPVGDTA